MLHKSSPVIVITVLLAAAPVAALAAEAVPLRSAVISGSTVQTQAELFSTYRDQLGQPVSRELAQSVAAGIAELYQADGYSRPEIKPDLSRAADGILRIGILEPYIAGVTIEGTPGRHREELEAIAGRLRESRPLRRDAVPQALAEMRRIPGLTVTPSTRRDGEAPNAYELTLRAEFSPVSGSLHANNRGTEQIGPHFVRGQVVANGLLGGNQRLGLIFSAAVETEEYLGGGLFYDTPLGDGGTRISAMIFLSDSAPNEKPLNLTDEYLRERASIRLTHSLGQATGQSLDLIAALEAEDLTVDRDGVDVRHDRLRVLEAGLRKGWRAGDATQFSSTLSLRQGLDALGAGLRADDLPVDNRRGDFLLAQLQATSVTRLNPSWTLRVDAFGQHSGHVLPDSERFKIGGERLGRGFEVAEIAGDQGLGAKVVLRRELTAEGSKFGRTSVYGLYDIGAAWKEDLPGRESAATGGVGFGLHGKRLGGYLEAVKPLTRADIEGKHSTALFAEISYRF